MTRRTAAWLAWPLWILVMTLLVTAMLLGLRNPDVDRGGIGEGLIFVLAFGTFGAFGAFLASLRPRNAVGWLYLGIVIGPVLAAFGTEYGTYALITRPGSLPAGEVMAWFSNWTWQGYNLVFFLLLLYPTGRLPSRRWRQVAWLAGFFLLSGAVLSAFAPGPLSDVNSIDNPFGLDVLRTLAGIDTIGAPIFFASTILAFVSLLARFRRAKSEERAQLKWFTFAAAAVVINVVVADLLPDSLELLSFGLFSISMVALPGATTLAILKYRLYDIDRIINRTLVYGLLTAILVGMYVGAVIGLGAGARSITDEANNSIVVAVSTLAVAALFRPARGRIQGFIDRRFYRRKYDAARTLEAFTSRLREEVDLDTLKTELLGVVRDTMQPAHASLWLRSGAGQR